MVFGLLEAFRISSGPFVRAESTMQYVSPILATGVVMVDVVTDSKYVMRGH